MADGIQSPREFYKAIHPDYFSDSHVDEATEVDRTSLEYHLSTLTDRSQEMDFERFARSLCEREVCPNLLPSTGPTGGGDSKVDTETYPVAERLALRWFTGHGEEAAKERWGFAFSAKKTWKPKLESDVAKIVETKRGYSKVFFVTNQSVSARARSEIEDKLRKQYNIDVRVLDRNWILTKTFLGRHEQLAISELGITTLKHRIVRLGPEDSNRKRMLDEIEKRITDGISKDQITSVLVDDALEAAGLARELESPRTEVEGLYLRADRLAMRYGTIRQQVEASYQWSWTLHWWYDDLDSLIDKYGTVENRALGSSNVYDIERLANLWTVANTRIKTTGQESILGEWLESHYQLLICEFARLSKDKDRPSTALQAEERAILLRIMHDLPDTSSVPELFDQLGSVLDRSDGLVGFPVDVIVRSIVELGKIVDDDQAYAALYDKVIQITSKREGEAKSAKLLLERSSQLMDQKLYSRAIAMAGKALTRLLKYETRNDIVFALYLCGTAYERIGLLWAARNTFMFGASIAANEFWTLGKITKGFAACVNRVKKQELLLGRLAHFLAWHEVDLVSRSRLAAKSDLPEVFEREDSLDDFLLARLLLHTSPTDLDRLRGLPDAMTGLGLLVSSAALLYLLGDVEPLMRIGRDANEEVAKVASTIYHARANVNLVERPWLGDATTILTSQVLGCRVTVSCSSQMQLVQVGEWILGGLESLLATSAIDRAYAYEPEVNVSVVPDAEAKEVLSFREEEVLGRPKVVVFYREPDGGKASQDEFGLMSEVVWQVVVAIMARTVRFEDVETDLATIIQEERASERAIGFTVPFVALSNVLGSSPKVEIEDWISEESTIYPNVRDTPWQPSGHDSADSPKTVSWGANHERPPSGLIDADRLSHEDITIISPIRMALWDRAGWIGAMYMFSPALDEPPVLGFVFSDEIYAREIFQSWIADSKKMDAEQLLRIVAVRGISAMRPSHYRLGVGPELSSTKLRKATLALQRIHTMTPDSTRNLDLFAEAVKRNGRYVLVPAIMTDDGPEPIMELGLGLYKFYTREAWQVGLNDPDMSMVTMEDDVIVPEGVVDPPVRHLQAWRVSRGDGPVS